jgi:hypothetical protein
MKFSVAVRLALDVARKERHSDFDLLRMFYDRSVADQSVERLDDRTWQDLDLDQVFLKLDFAVSEPGRQCLYDMLRTPQRSVESLQELERGVARCSTDDALGDRIRAALAPLNDRRSAYLVNLLYGELPSRPPLWWLTATSIACLALVAVWPRALIVWIVVCAINICVQLSYKPRVKRFIPAIHELPKFLGAAERLGGIEQAELANDAARLRDGAKKIRGLRPATLWLKFEPNQTNELVSSLYEYVNLLFLLDVNAFVFTVEIIRRARGPMREMFEALSRLDALQSIARWRAGLSEWTTPVFTEPQKECDVENIAHPLLDEPVRSSLHIDQRSILISGSNMSGKTTFVRALGVNAVLAQALHTVCAARWVGPVLRVRTFIGRADSIMEGKSYYLAEAEAILALVRAKDTGVQHLFLLDEIFRGTNTTERIAAASAVLAHLTSGTDLVVVATHDLEVLDLLGDLYAAHHFTEQIGDGGLSFDYRIRPGASSTRNAIALLEFMDYPEQVIADATANLDWQTRRPDRP